MKMNHRYALKLLSLVLSLVLLSACITIVVPNSEATPTGSGSAPTGAQHVGLIVFPEDDEQLLLDRISAARERVYLTIYMLTDDRVIDALKTAQSNGAEVRVLLEPHPYLNDSYASQARTKLQQAGITTLPSNPFFKYTHQKSFVVDDTGIILTANMTRSALTRNREFGIIDSDKAIVDEMVAAFNADWAREPFTPTNSTLTWSPVNSRDRVDSVIRSATKTLIVYAEEVQDDEQTQLLADTARRGVDVRLITTPPSGSADSGSADLDRLQQGGVKVRLLKSPYIHAKVFIADGTFGAVGSMNISMTSLEFNRELGILIQDTSALSRITQAFDKDWNKATDR
jgi:phosphatidylserine/phosphatidylglycerophosphate/cardiolipin synthase-like enzyme